VVLNFALFIIMPLFYFSDENLPWSKGAPALTYNQQINLPRLLSWYQLSTKYLLKDITYRTHVAVLKLL